MSRRLITIKADDGRLFSGNDYEALENEVNAYEADLKLKKQKEEAERKTREEKERELAQYRSTKLKEINDILQKASEMVDDYEKATGRKLTYTYDYIKGKFTVDDGTRNSIDFAWDNFFDDFFKALHKK